MCHTVFSILRQGVMAILVLAIASGCNKLGYGEPRHTPDGSAAMLGPKRLPQQNAEKLEKQGKAIVKQRSAPQAASNNMLMQRPVAPLPAAIPPNYPVTPYVMPPQSAVTTPAAPASLPRKNSQYSQSVQPYNASVPTPNHPYYQQYPAGSYYQTPLAAPQPVASVSQANAPYPSALQQFAPQMGQYTPSMDHQSPMARMVNVVTETVTPTAANPFGRYPDGTLATQPVSAYQPVDALTDARAHQATNNYAAEVGDAYDNIFYGGESMGGAMEGKDFLPNYDMADSQGLGMTNGYAQRAAGRIEGAAYYQAEHGMAESSSTPIGYTQPQANSYSPPPAYDSPAAPANAAMRKSLEVPPALLRQESRHELPAYYRYDQYRPGYGTH